MANEIGFDGSRRGFLRAGMAVATTMQLQRAAFALGLGGDAEVCRLMPEQEVGPFYIAGEKVRADITEGEAGVPLELRLMVLDARTCKPLVGAAVDIWQCDAMGLYSGYTKEDGMGGPPPGGPGGPGGPPPPGFDAEHGPGGEPPQMPPSDKLTFLRGIQMTGVDGSVRFRTVFPGFYMGRTNHIHFKVRVGGEEAGKMYKAGHTSHVGQVFFPEEISTELMRQEPYSRHAIHRTTLAEDGVFGGQNGRLSMAKLEALAQGYRAELVASVDPTATPGPARR